MGASIIPDGDGRLLRLSIRLDRGVGVAVGAGVVLALTGAFGTNIVPLWLRFTYWVPLILAGAVWAHLCSRLIERLIDPDERPWLTVAALSATTAGPVVGLVWLVTGLVFENRVYPVSRLVGFIGPVLIITVAISAINVFLGRSPAVQTHAGVSGTAPARFLDRLPPKLRGATLHAVQAEDHYLRLHTDRGSDLILMRLSDAVGRPRRGAGRQPRRRPGHADARGRDRRPGQPPLRPGPARGRLVLIIPARCRGS